MAIPLIPYVNIDRIPGGTETVFTKNVYRMTTAAMEHFSRPEVQAWMRERVKEKPSSRFWICAQGTTAFADGTIIAEVDDAWANARFADGFWGYAINGGVAYADERGVPLNPARTAQQYQELFGKPAPVGMFGEMTNVIHGEDGGIYPSQPLKLESIRWEPAPLSHGMIGTDPLTGDLAYRSKTGEVTVIGVKDLRELAPLSNNCASCGDALHETYDPSRVVGGQRHHGTCADRVERLKAEQAPKVGKADPYREHREDLVNRYGIKDDAKASEAMKNWYGPIVRFTADQVPASKYREKFGAHPWEADE